MNEMTRCCVKSSSVDVVAVVAVVVAVAVPSVEVAEDRDDRGNGRFRNNGYLTFNASSFSISNRKERARTF
jgi:hypothetical protein